MEPFEKQFPATVWKINSIINILNKTCRQPMQDESTLLFYADTEYKESNELEESCGKLKEKTTLLTLIKSFRNPIQWKIS